MTPVDFYQVTIGTKLSWNGVTLEVIGLIDSTKDTPRRVKFIDEPWQDWDTVCTECFHITYPGVT